MEKQLAKRQLIALDLDGTILKEVHTIPPEMVEVLRTLHSKGYIILINTGRTFAYSRQIFNQLDFPFFGGFTNGVALAHIVKEETFRKLAENKTAENKTDLKYHFNSQNTIKRENFLIDVKYEVSLPEGLLPTIKSIFEKQKIDPIFQSGIRGGDTTTYEPLKYPNNELIEILSEDPERRIQVESILDYDSSQFVSVFGCTKNFEGAEKIVNECETIEGLYAVAFLHSYFLDTMWLTVGSKNVNKGLPVKKLKGMFDLKQENIYAFGNDRNDIPMLLEAGTAVAVENSPEEVLAVANYTVKKPEEDGVLSFLKELV